MAEVRKETMYVDRGPREGITTEEVGYPSNSHKARAEREKNKPVVTKRPVRHKESVGEKLVKAFLPTDGKDVGEYLLYDVLIPGLQQMIVMGVTGGVTQLFNGQKIDPNLYRQGTRTYVDYTNPSRKVSNATRERTRSRYDFSTLVFDSRTEAEAVLRAMDEIILTYGEVTCRDFLEFAGEPSEFTDAKYGWRDISRAYIEPARSWGGFVIKLPPVRALD